MLYIFNSGEHKEYLDNLMKVLVLQNKSVVRFSYRYQGEKQHIDNNSLNYLKNLDENTALILFVDKTNYTYYPLRLAKIINIKFEDNKVKIYLRLKEFIYFDNIKEFNLKLKGTLVNPPHKVGRDKQDGSYVVHGDDIKKYEFRYFCANDTEGDVWLNIVRMLYEKKNFSYNLENESYYPFFFFCSIKDNHGKAVPIRFKDEMNYFILKRNKNYNLKINSCNLYLNTENRRYVALDIKKNGEIYPKNINSKYGDVLFNFTCDRTEDTIKVVFCDKYKNNASNLWATSMEFRTLSKANKMKPFFIWFVFPLIYILSSFIISNNVGLENIGQDLKDNYRSLIISFLQIYSIIGITYFHGNKIF